MNDMDLKDAFAEAIARRAAEIVLADLEKTKRTDYDPTRRLSRHEAARKYSFVAHERRAVRIIST